LQLVHGLDNERVAGCPVMPVPGQQPDADRHRPQTGVGGFGARRPRAALVLSYLHWKATWIFTPSSSRRMPWYTRRPVRRWREHCRAATGLHPLIRMMYRAYALKRVAAD
ncbi:MAG: hypothetical protein WCC93_05570, partial [Chthoniobacterales bacterium]